MASLEVVRLMTSVTVHGGSRLLRLAELIGPVYVRSVTVPYPNSAPNYFDFEVELASAQVDSLMEKRQSLQNIVDGLA